MPTLFLPLSFFCGFKVLDMLTEILGLRQAILFYFLLLLVTPNSIHGISCLIKQVDF